MESDQKDTETVQNTDSTSAINTDSEKSENAEPEKESEIKDENTISETVETDTQQLRNENIPNTEYSTENVHYEGSVAIYTDPNSGYQFQWCNEKNEWISKTNVTYGFENDTHTYTDSDGVTYFWDKEKKAWFPKVDDDFLARYQMSYGFVDNTSDSKNAELKKTENVGSEVDDNAENSDQKNKGEKRKPAEPTWFELDEQHNTKVYVSNLPLDITEEEFVDFMQKCGLVERDVATEKMKIRLYRDPETNDLKGDGLCTYIKIESVELALNLLDGSDLRGNKIKVERAKFQMKGSSYDPRLKPKRSRKRKEKEKLKKMQEKLFDWRPERMRGERAKHERVVIVKNLFDPILFDKEVSLILEYQQDLREECTKCGEVRRVVLYDRHPEGVAQITMSDPEEADLVVKLLNNRWFGQRQITAEIWDGKTKYKIAETDTENSKRLNNWDKFLDDGTEASKKEKKKKQEENDKKVEESKKEPIETIPVVSSDEKTSQ